MDHIGRGPHQIDGVEHDHRLGTVGHSHGDPVAGTNAGGLQCPGAEVDFRRHSAVGGFPAHEHIGSVVGIGFRAALHGLIHGAVRVIQMGRHHAVNIQPRRFHMGFLCDFCLFSSQGRWPPSRVCPAAPGGSSGAARFSGNGRNRSRPPPVRPR